MRIWTFISGWRLRSALANAMAIALMCCVQTLFANEPENMPSMEFLEFISEGVEVENEWVDPIRYQELDGLTKTKEQAKLDEQTDE